MGDAGAAAVDLGYARSRLLGAPVRKQLGGAWLKGRVIAEEAEASDGETDFRVVYEDGEETVMPESEVRLWAAACGLDLGPSASGDDGDESCEEAPPAEPPPESAQPMTSAATPSPFTQPGHVQPLSSAPIPPSSRTALGTRADAQGVAPPPRSAGAKPSSPERGSLVAGVPPPQHRAPLGSSWVPELARSWAPHSGLPPKSAALRSTSSWPTVFRLAALAGSAAALLALATRRGPPAAAERPAGRGGPAPGSREEAWSPAPWSAVPEPNSRDYLGSGSDDKGHAVGVVAAGFEEFGATRGVKPQEFEYHSPLSWHGDGLGDGWSATRESHSGSQSSLGEALAGMGLRSVLDKLDQLLALGVQIGHRSLEAGGVGSAGDDLKQVVAEAFKEALGELAAGGSTPGAALGGGARWWAGGGGEDRSSGARAAADAELGVGAAATIEALGDVAAVAASAVASAVASGASAGLGGAAACAEALLDALGAALAAAASAASAAASGAAAAVGGAAALAGALLEAAAGGIGSASAEAAVAAEAARARLGVAASEGAAAAKLLGAGLASGAAGAVEDTAEGAAELASAARARLGAAAAEGGEAAALAAGAAGRGLAAADAAADALSAGLIAAALEASAAARGALGRLQGSLSDSLLSIVVGMALARALVSIQRGLACAADAPGGGGGAAAAADAAPVFAGAADAAGAPAVERWAAASAEPWASARPVGASAAAAPASAAAGAAARAAAAGLGAAAGGAAAGVAAGVATASTIAAAALGSLLGWPALLAAPAGALAAGLAGRAAAVALAPLRLAALAALCAAGLARRCLAAAGRAAAGVLRLPLAPARLALAAPRRLAGLCAAAVRCGAAVAALELAALARLLAASAAAAVAAARLALLLPARCAALAASLTASTLLSLARAARELLLAPGRLLVLSALAAARLARLAVLLPARCVLLAARGIASVVGLAAGSLASLAPAARELGLASCLGYSGRALLVAALATGATGSVPAALLLLVGAALTAVLAPRAKVPAFGRCCGRRAPWAPWPQGHAVAPADAAGPHPSSGAAGGALLVSAPVPPPSPLRVPPGLELAGGWPAPPPAAPWPDVPLPPAAADAAPGSPALQGSIEDVPCAPRPPTTVTVGGHYIAAMNGTADVVKAIAHGSAPGTVLVLPCKRSRIRTFRQVHAHLAVEIPIYELLYGPFLVWCGRAPAFVHERLQAYRGELRPAQPAVSGGSGWCPQRRPLSLLDADGETITPQSSLVLSRPRFKYVSKLRHLRTMGFKSDESVLMELITRLKGDVHACVCELVQGPAAAAAAAVVPAPGAWDAAERSLVDRCGQGPCAPDFSTVGLAAAARRASRGGA